MTQKSPWMPDFAQSLPKYIARELHMGFLFPLFTGNICIPENKSYWYLCNIQDDAEGSEIFQLTKKVRNLDGNNYLFAKPNQCYGVDRSRNIIKLNKKLHPKSNWIADEWLPAIRCSDKFDPALVYLDTTSFAECSPATTVLANTLSHCKKNTLVIANVMMNNARSGSGNRFFDQNSLIDNLLRNEHPETFIKWNISPENPEDNIFYSYEYQHTKTLMRSYIFFKGVLPHDDSIKREFSKVESCRLSSVSLCLT